MIYNILKNQKHVREYNSTVNIPTSLIDSILKTTEWIEFEKFEGPQTCYNTCRKNKKESEIQTLKMIDTKTNKIIFKDQR
jgi:hypothetical protein